MTGREPAEHMAAGKLHVRIDSRAKPAQPVSKHLELAVAAAFYRRQRNLAPLPEGSPVPGCGCEHCTGIADCSPARVVPLRTRFRRAAYREPLDVDSARSVPILDVARRIGLDPVRQGKEWVARCPLHGDDKPSLRLNTVKNLWHCFPCGEGGDGIRLLQRARGITFSDAVRQIGA